MDIKKILTELESERERIDAAITAVEALAGRESRVGRQAGNRGGASSAVASTAAQKKRNLTPAGRKRLSENMKRRWAERRRATAKLGKAA